VSHNI